MLSGLIHSVDSSDGVAIVEYDDGTGGVDIWQVSVPSFDNALLPRLVIPDGATVSLRSDGPSMQAYIAGLRFTPAV